MSSEEIKRLKRKFGGVKSQLTSLENFLESITHETNIETLDLESRLNQKVLPLLTIDITLFVVNSNL